MTYLEMARRAGAENDEVADFLLWSGTAFPFAPVRHIWNQLRHVLRHKVCADDPMATCGPRYARVPRPSSLATAGL